MNRGLHFIHYQQQRGRGWCDIQAHLVTVCLGAENTAVPIPIQGEWLVKHKRGLRRKQEHNQGYSALGCGIPQLWGEKIEKGRKPQEGQPAMGW